MKGHIPIRTCLVCARKNAKDSMVRLALDSQTGAVAPDLKQRLMGRGGYTCPDCLQKLRFDKRVQRAFRGAARELLLS
ncbi:MAG: DUF448 domain-containing protein [Syntrophobacter sp.]